MDELSLNVEELKVLREQLITQQQAIFQDMDATYAVLNDPKLDYLSKRELENDLINDRRELAAIAKKLEQLEKLLTAVISTYDETTEEPKQK